MNDKSAADNLMNGMLEMQMQMLNIWKRMFVPSTQSGTEPFGPISNFTELTNQWLKFNNDFFYQHLNFGGFGEAQDTLKRLLGSNEVYLGLFRFWEDLTTQLNGGQKQVNSFFSQWQEQYAQLIANNLVPFVPEPLRIAFKEPQEIVKMYMNILNKLYNPWTDNYAELQSLLLKGLTGSKDAYLQFVTRWKEIYENTFARLFQIPSLGMSREFAQKISDSMDKFVRYIQTVSEYSATVYKVGLESMEALAAKYLDMLKQGTQPKTFKEFYELWWTTNEEAYQTLFGTENFSKLLAQVVDATVIFKRNQDALVEEFLRDMPIPVKSDMDGLYKTVYELKKEIKKLRKEIESLKSEMGEDDE